MNDQVVCLPFHRILYFGPSLPTVSRLVLNICFTDLSQIRSPLLEGETPSKITPKSEDLGNDVVGLSEEADLKALNSLNFPNERI